MITPSENSIIISPIGYLEKSLLKLVCEEVSIRFGYRVEVLSLLKHADFAFDPMRMQYHSTKILEKLSHSAPPHATKILAIYNKDLFIPILTHVYGEAQLGGKSCIISLFRLHENLQEKDDSFFTNRIVKEAIHELGHTFNLRHCSDHTCAMHYCRSIDDVDEKSDKFCRYCNVLLKDEIKRIKSCRVHSAKG